MTNIPKKLEPTLETGMVDLGNKINEIIDCLESKQTTNVCDCSKKDINKSKGKCEHDKDLLCERCFNPNPPEHEIKSPEFDMDKFKHSAEEAKKTFEHEESWEREIRDENWDTEAGIMTKQVYLRHGRKIGTATTPLKVEMIIEYIKSNFVSKEKIKKWSDRLRLECDVVVCDCGEKVRDWDISDLVNDMIKDLGLGD